MKNNHSKIKLELNKDEIKYLAGVMELDIRYTKDKERLEMMKKLLNYLKMKLEEISLANSDKK